MSHCFKPKVCIHFFQPFLSYLQVACGPGSMVIGGPPVVFTWVRGHLGTWHWHTEDSLCVAPPPAAPCHHLRAAVSVLPPGAAPETLRPHSGCLREELAFVPSGSLFTSQCPVGHLPGGPGFKPRSGAPPVGSRLRSAGCSLRFEHRSRSGVAERLSWRVSLSSRRGRWCCWAPCVAQG